MAGNTALSISPLWGRSGTTSTPSKVPETPYPAAPPVTSPQPYAPSPMANMAQQYWQQQSNKPVYTPEMQQALESRLTNQLNTQLAAAQEGMGAQYGQGGQTGAMRDALARLYQQGLAGRGNILADVQMQMAGAEAQNRLGWGNLGAGLAGTLGSQNLNEWLQTQYQPYLDAMSQNMYYAQLGDEQAWRDRLMKLMGIGAGYNSAPVISY